VLWLSSYKNSQEPITDSDNIDFHKTCKRKFYSVWYWRWIIRMVAEIFLAIEHTEQK